MRIAPRRRPGGRDAGAPEYAPRAEARPRSSEQRADHSSGARARGGLRTDSPHRGPHRLVFRQRAVENSRADRSDDGRRGHAAGPARPRDSAAREAPWISGAWRFTNPAGGCGCLRRCESRAARGWSSARNPRAPRRVLRQIAQFEPRGLVGLLYWYLLWPVHEVMFRGMLRRIAAAAADRAQREAGRGWEAA